ncbi:MAG TPA: GGDEF domain-containing protein [Beijerinckiaceae bacterium]|jgi:diguanylate cyclase
MKDIAGKDTERTFEIAQKALELMKAYGTSAYPRSYEVWYTYVSGHKPLLNDAIKRLTARQGTLSDVDIDSLYDTYLCGHHFSDEAEQTGLNVLAEIDEVMEMLDLALGSTTKYGESLEAFSKDLAGPIDRSRVREVLESLVLATRDVSSTNKTLEARLKETRSEIETMRETLEAVRLESLTDPLTGISNRKHFEEMLIKAIDLTVTQRTPLALVIIDIDHFKHFNDTYGHLTGDQVLRLVGVTMRERVKKTKATLARFGGEEFGVILPETTLDSARATAEQIRESVMSRELVKRSTGESLGKVTVSLGVAAFRKGDTSVSLLERADQCMFMAKRAGRNRTVTDAEYPEGNLPDAA